MNPSTRTKAKLLLQVVANLLFATTALTFVFGGGFIHAVRGTDLLLADIEGYTLTLLCGGLGVLAQVLRGGLEGAKWNRIAASRGVTPFATSCKHMTTPSTADPTDHS
jgi:hypothetical protein